MSELREGCKKNLIASKPAVLLASLQAVLERRPQGVAVTRRRQGQHPSSLTAIGTGLLNL